jgi:hypothetical protein
MALKAKLTSDEFKGLETPLQSFYRQGTDGYVLDAEGVEDVAGLKKVLEEVKSERARLREINASMREKYGDIDPDKAREAMTEFQKLQDKKLLDEGKVEELINQRIERMRLEHENQIKARDRKIAEMDASSKSLSSKLSEVLIDSSLTAAATKARVRATALEDVLLRGRQVWRLDGDTPKPMKGDGTVIIGNDGKNPLSVEEWLGSLQQSAPHLFEASTGSGTDSNGGSFAGSGRQIVLTREQARDVQMFRQAQAEAAKTGAQVLVRD